ncbi:MAG TPA: hypothetical protein VLA56_09590 [Pseudomonadales bacterium]|nr:hypothetical protein [Pseudomonadales bacterium]
MVDHDHRPTLTRRHRALSLTMAVAMATTLLMPAALTPAAQANIPRVPFQELSTRDAVRAHGLDRFAAHAHRDRRALAAADAETAADDGAEHRVSDAGPWALPRALDRAPEPAPCIEQS